MAIQVRKKKKKRGSEWSALGNFCSNGAWLEKVATLQPLQKRIHFDVKVVTLEQVNRQRGSRGITLLSL